MNLSQKNYLDGQTDITITHWPVLILGNYRSGTNLVGRYISKMHNAVWLNEPTRGNRLENFSKVYNSENKKFVLKIMPDQLGLLKETDDIYNSDCFKIKIKRRDTLSQVISYYIASVSNTWVQLSKTKDPYYVTVNYKKLKTVTDIIKKNNHYLDTTKTKFNLELYYEDLNLDTKHIDLFKTVPPVNYDLVKQKIEHWYQKNT